MERKDNADLIIAFAAGAVLGAGVAFLFRPLRTDPVLARRLLTRARHSGGHLRERAGRAGSSLAHASHEVLEQFRDEVGEIVRGARQQLAREVYAQLRGGTHARGRGRRARR